MWRHAGFAMWLALSACRASEGEAKHAAAVASPPECRPMQLTTQLDLVVLGSGGPRAAGRAASSYLLSIGGTPTMLVDVGPGAFLRLGQLGVATDKLEMVLLTHLHIDHVGDLAAFVKSRDLFDDKPVNVQIFGPTGAGLYPSTSAFVDRLFGAQGAFAYLPSFRNELKLAVEDVPTDLAAGPRIVLERGGLVVTAVAVDHDDVPALAYRVEHKGQSVVFSGDLASKHSRIAELAKSADVLVYDAAVLDPPGSPANLYALHTAPHRIGEVARDAGVKVLLLSHIPPIVDANREQVLASVRRAFAGDVRFAEDCLHYPVGVSK